MKGEEFIYEIGKRLILKTGDKKASDYLVEKINHENRKRECCNLFWVVALRLGFLGRFYLCLNNSVFYKIKNKFEVENYKL